MRDWGMAERAGGRERAARERREASRVDGCFTRDLRMEKQGRDQSRTKT